MQGASYQDEFAYDTKLKRLSAEDPDRVPFVASVSRPSAARNAGWSGPTGRIHLLLDEYVDTWGLRPDDTAIYLCGHPGMIGEASERLRPQGWSVTTEQYWRAGAARSPGRRPV